MHAVAATMSLAHPLPEAPLTLASRERLLLAAAFVAVWIIWGSTCLGIAIETLPPLVMAGMRFDVAGVILLSVLIARGQVLPSAIEWRSASIVGVLMLVGGNGLVTIAEKDVP